jgi:hypothetical protein
MPNATSGLRPRATSGPQQHAASALWPRATPCAALDLKSSRGASVVLLGF